MKFELLIKYNKDSFCHFLRSAIFVRFALGSSRQEFEKTGGKEASKLVQLWNEQYFLLWFRKRWSVDMQEHFQSELQFL